MSSFWNSPAWSMGKRSATSKKPLVIGVPGPGDYNYAGNSKHTPSWKIGKSNRDGKKYEQIPGPGEYNLGGSKSGPKITIASKPKVNSLGQTLQPGPGNYNPNIDGISRNPNSYTMGSKYGALKVQDPEPGPGTYTISNSKKSGVKIGKSKRNNELDKEDLPGPGQYATFDRPFSAGPKYGFGHESKSLVQFDQRPGPGQYETQGVNFGYTSKGCVIGTKFNKKSENNIGPGPGCYDVASKRPQSGVKIGKADRNNFGESFGPGPGAYDVNNYRQKNPNEAKMGSSLRKDFSRGQTPGPGTYDLIKNKSKGITISGFKGKNGIQITPGPGAYDLNNNQVSKRPCSAKIGKGQRSNIPFFDTPGPGHYNQKDSHNYKFAYNKQIRSKDLNKDQIGPGQYDIPVTVPSAPHYLIDPSIYKSYH